LWFQHPSPPLSSLLMFPRPVVQSHQRTSPGGVERRAGSNPAGGAKVWFCTAGLGGAAGRGAPAFFFFKYGDARVGTAPPSHPPSPVCRAARQESSAPLPPSLFLLLHSASTTASPCPTTWPAPSPGACVLPSPPPLFLFWPAGCAAIWAALLSAARGHAPHASALTCPQGGAIHMCLHPGGRCPW